MDQTHSRPPLRLPVGVSVVVGLTAVLLAFLAIGAVSYSNIRALWGNVEAAEHTQQVLLVLGNLLSLAKDAETGQRGFVITGNERYLAPHTEAVDRIPAEIDELERLVRDNPDQRDHLPTLRGALLSKLHELDDTIALRRKQGFEAAQKEVMTDRGKAAMDTIRAEIDAMQEAERRTRIQRVGEMQLAYEKAVSSAILTSLLGFLLSAVVAYLLRRAAVARERQDWIQSGQIQVSQLIGGNPQLAQMGDNMLRFLCQYLDAYAAAFYASEGSAFLRVATYGVPGDALPPAQFTAGDGLLGQAVRDRRSIAVKDVPAGYLTVGSALGRTDPRQLLIVPVAEDGQINGVFEFGFLHEVKEPAPELFDRLKEPIGTAIRSIYYRRHLQNLLEETQRQGEELQAQSEELRVSNEELEEQSRALRESQARLENQQAELEQINADLEQQTELLEKERNQTRRANAILDEQAQKLAQSSQYKSDFLANMSHELRTPLNSSLILAKLLADNTAGNLTAEQVEYAETIQAAGNDLLSLINDILDLSKIEAGRMDIRVESVPIEQLLADLARFFQPLATQKHLNFQYRREPACPDVINTDRQRLEQILKNLLSNAIKFTEHGTIALTVSPAAGGKMDFAVADTGIGIPPEQQQAVFEAFRQVDGTPHRKQGGTGLGLSISRELAKLLGGDLRLMSEPGRGSTFVLSLPASIESASTKTPARFVKDDLFVDETDGRLRSENSTTAASPPTRAAQRARRRVDDDRSPSSAGLRSILIVEDDESFAKILCELVREMSFLCVAATTAEEGFDLALEQAPSAIVLDIGLPDHSGLWVLDRLKHDRRTRHIPVHVISATDQSQTARELGAVGYLLKPVQRDEVALALRQLEARLSQEIGRVLVVEDDPVQRAAVCKLLASHDLETVGAATGAECLEELKQKTFDCMVLDLSLPDSSGYALLETLSREEAYSFPPVIVYTGRELSADEEQRLRRYSKSIIIKGARSPERLLDEVTLFLHKVVSDLPADQQRMLDKARVRDAALEGRRILIVEDDVRNVFALTRMLETRGVTVDIARNGHEALQALEQSSPAGNFVDLVLMDVMMPEMDGLTAVREIRKRSEWKKMPIIMLTAKAMPDDQAECLAAGASDYLAKPLDVDKLLSLIRVWLPR
jgi:CheY-like chemotaxis protein/CHASE3 domain sensor protein/putative methionine-R-sulfoxide reductase with GAF domain